MSTHVAVRPNGKTFHAINQVTQEMQTRHDDQVYWWTLLSQSFATMLRTSQYSEKDQLYYIRWFQKWVLSSLGPQPVGGNAFYPPTFIYDGSPIEFSLNWKEKKMGQTVRFTTEPVTGAAGTVDDPLNQRASRDLLTEMSKDVPGIDLARFSTFLEETNVPDVDAEQVLSKLPPGHPRARVLVAYDLEQGVVVPKAYFNPEMRAILDSSSTKDVVFNAIRKSNGQYGSYDAAINVLDGYLESQTVPGGPHVFMLANDCVPDSPGSRVKVYVTTPVTTLASVLDAFSLSGRLSGSSIEYGLEAVRSFWCHLFGTDGENSHVLPEGSRGVFVYEMRPSTQGQQGTDVEVKLHMPGSWLGETDAEVSDKLSAWFHKHGHSDLSERYQSDLASTL